MTNPTDTNSVISEMESDLCRCDVMRGYVCDVHYYVKRLRKSLPHPEPRKDVEAVGSVEELAAHILEQLESDFGRSGPPVPFEIIRCELEAFQQRILQSARKDIERKVAQGAALECRRYAVIQRQKDNTEGAKAAYECAGRIEAAFLTPPKGEGGEG